MCEADYKISCEGAHRDANTHTRAHKRILTDTTPILSSQVLGGNICMDNTDNKHSWAHTYTHTYCVNIHSACGQRLAGYRRTNVSSSLAAWHLSRQISAQLLISLNPCFFHSRSMSPFHLYSTEEYVVGVVDVHMHWKRTTECVVTWQQLHAHKHPMTTLFELKFNEGYVYLSPLFL